MTTYVVLEDNTIVYKSNDFDRILKYWHKHKSDEVFMPFIGAYINMEKSFISNVVDGE